jgi:predicted histone-like DNA-binding protein
MINYSTVKRKNLLKPEETPKTYATAQYDRVMELEEFAEHIAEHNSKYSEADIMAVTIMTVKCLRECILDGKKVRLGKLGDFWVTLNSKGVEDGTQFTASNITSCNILFTPGKDFDDLLTDAEFRVVATRALQAAAVKAEKEGAKTIDVDEAKKKNNANDNENVNGNGDDDGGDDNPTPPNGNDDTGNDDNTDDEGGIG